MGSTPMLVVGLTILFVVLLNVLLISMARGSLRETKILKRAVKSVNKPFTKDEEQLQELSQLVGKLSQEEAEED